MLKNEEDNYLVEQLSSSFFSNIDYDLIVFIH